MKEKNEKIRVLIVDDSALVRAMLTEMINSDPRMEVVGSAIDPLQARDLIKQTNPDVMTLDVEMPRMNGIAFLKNVMRLRPMPVVMISTLTQKGAPATLEALELGAFDFVAKPKTTGDAGLAAYRGLIVERILAASKVNMAAIDSVGSKRGGPLKPPSANGKKLKNKFICAIGASTGGTEAIKEVITALPKESPPIVMAQHIPAAFSTSFAQRLDDNSEITVREAEENMPIKPGNAYLAPGDDHLRVVQSSYGYVCKLDKAPPVNRHRPSVEVLFKSVAEACGNKSIGIMLTGMGADGSEALLEMREQGSFTIAQDEATSVVWGMPGVAVKLNAAIKVLPLNSIAQEILNQSFQ